MGLEITRLRDGNDAGRGAIRADRHLYVTADRKTLVEETNAAAAFQLAAPGHVIARADVERLSLVVHEGRVVQSFTIATATEDEETAERIAARAGEQELAERTARYREEVEAAGYEGEAVDQIVAKRLEVDTLVTAGMSFEDANRVVFEGEPAKDENDQGSGKSASDEELKSRTPETDKMRTPGEHKGTGKKPRG